MPGYMRQGYPLSSDFSVKLVMNESTGNVYACVYLLRDEMIAYFNVTPDYIKIRDSSAERKKQTEDHS
jgi:DNA-binding transcriptional regulator GbsR (MarR family)